MLDTKVTKTGTMLIHDGKIMIEGFSAPNCMCREVAAHACLWAIGLLQKELTSLIDHPGGDISSIDLPADIRIALGMPDYIDMADEGKCAECGCTDDDCSQCIEKTGAPCYWANDEKTLCSACTPKHQTPHHPLYTSPYDQAAKDYENVTYSSAAQQFEQLSEKFTPERREALKRFESICGFEPMHQDDFAAGTISFSELWSQNVNWLHAAFCEVQNIRIPDDAVQQGGKA